MQAGPPLDDGGDTTLARLGISQEEFEVVLADASPETRREFMKYINNEGAGEAQVVSETNGYLQANLARRLLPTKQGTQQHNESIGHVVLADASPETRREFMKYINGERADEAQVVSETNGYMQANLDRFFQRNKDRSNIMKALVMSSAK